MDASHTVRGLSGLFGHVPAAAQDAKHKALFFRLLQCFYGMADQILLDGRVLCCQKQRVTVYPPGHTDKHSVHLLILIKRSETQ